MYTIAYTAGGQARLRRDAGDACPWIVYLCRILAEAYDDFEQRAAAAGEQTRNWAAGDSLAGKPGSSGSLII